MLLTTLLRGSELLKIVLLGDVLQLPSIEPGNLMSDIFSALKVKNFVVELNTNHRSEGRLLFDTAKRISQRQMPIFDR